jgi:hypothetical protein
LIGGWKHRKILSCDIGCTCSHIQNWISISTPNSFHDSQLLSGDTSLITGECIRCNRILCPKTPRPRGYYLSPSKKMKQEYAPLRTLLLVLIRSRAKRCRYHLKSQMRKPEHTPLSEELFVLASISHIMKVLSVISDPKSITCASESDALRTHRLSDHQDAI